jgi:hypothetical protein
VEVAVEKTIDIAMILKCYESDSGKKEVEMAIDIALIVTVEVAAKNNIDLLY